MTQFSLFVQEPQPAAGQALIDIAQSLAGRLTELAIDERMEAINQIRAILHEVSPMKSEPVDFVRWVKNTTVHANDYNPNTVAPPEMELLAHSIMTDGYTQPIVTFATEKGCEVVDGFHRNRVGKENGDVCSRVAGYLPVVSIKSSQAGLNDRIAATIRHNRARGKHRVEAMSDIVVELKKRNWSDQRIAKELGMDADEVLRLIQITGLAELFVGQEFSMAWEPDSKEELSMEILSDVPENYQPKQTNRILHTWEHWECYKAGFYAERPPNGLAQADGEILYREFLSDQVAFDSALQHVTREWKNSCEHYLTNDRMNRIAWLGQASAAHAIGMPSCCRGGYHLLSDQEKADADTLALMYLNQWLEQNNRPAVTMEQAGGRTEAELY